MRLGGRYSARPLARALQCASIVLAMCGAIPEVLHAEDASYSLGSIQEEREVRLSAGSSTFTTLGFYNIDGNVPTTVQLQVAEAPEGWFVFLERAGQVADATDELSLVVEPSVPESAATQWSGVDRESVWLPQRGWIYADVVRVRVEAPASAIEGAQGVVRVMASVSWDAGGGSAPFPQEREFVFNTIVAGVEGPHGVADASTETPHSVSHSSLLLAYGLGVLGLLLVLRRALVKTKNVA